MKPYKNEGDLRKDFMQRCLPHLIRIEHRSGGTAGVGDCYLLHALGGTRFHVPLEFKLRERYKGKKPLWTQLDSIWNVEMRPSQWAFGRKMVELGVPFVVVVGREGCGWDEIGYFFFSELYWDNAAEEVNAEMLPATTVLLKPLVSLEDALRDRIHSAVFNGRQSLFKS